MRTMFQAGDFFVRITDKGGRPKLAVWSSDGEKIVSEFLSMSNIDELLSRVESVTSADVTTAITEKLKG